MDAIDRLHLSLDTRVSPEVTAALVLDAIGDRLLPSHERVLRRVADSTAAGYSSMYDDFARPQPLTHKAQVLAALLNDPAELDAERLAADPWLLVGQVAVTGQMHDWPAGRDFRKRANRDFRKRANRARRAELGIDLSNRQYNRLVRHLTRTHIAAHKMARQVLLRQLLMVARTGLAPTITAEQMHADPDAAAFVAYWTAMRKRRREFTLAGRDSPFDAIARMLLIRCELRGPATDWRMIACVRPTPDIVGRLADEQRGEMLGQWATHMRVAALLLKELYEAWPARDIPPVLPDSMWAERPGLMPSAAARGAKRVPVVNLETMVVNKGIDSSTWNTVAGAYNAARDGWLACLASAGALGLLEAACPGKAMRLMAGDLQAWHQHAQGSAAHPQTIVWARLPLPWKVLSGEEDCPASLVEDVCLFHGVDPAETGWTGPRAHAGVVADWKPTPELVHGITVADPLWAGVLRKAGVWSGKPVGPDAADLPDAYRQNTVTAP